MAKKYDVVSVGSATVDCFVRLPVDFNNIRHGSKVLIDDIKLLTGGGGGNVAVGLARLGLRTGFIAEVGEDLSAHMIKHEMQQEHVDFIVKSHSRHLTAYSVVLEAKGKDRSILVYKGASSFLHPEEIPKDLDAGWFYFASVVGTSFKTMDLLSGFAKRKKIKIFFNPSEYMITKGGKLIKDIVSATTIISLNKEEAQSLTRCSSTNSDELLKRLKSLGPEVCIITNGKEGVHAYDGKSFYFKRARKMDAVDTTGAGDAFGAGFLGGWILNERLPQELRMNISLKMGLLNSESVISYVGAKRGLLHNNTMKKELGGYDAVHK